MSPATKERVEMWADCGLPDIESERDKTAIRRKDDKGRSLFVLRFITCEEFQALRAIGKLTAADLL